MTPSLNFFLPVRIRIKNIIPLCLAAVFALGPGEAAAQGCPNTGPVAVTVDGAPAIIPSLYENLLAAGIAQGPTSEIYCSYGLADRYNRHVVVHSPAITVVDDFVSGIEARHQGVGHLGVYVHAIDDWVPGTPGTFSHPHPLDLNQGIWTRGSAADYITGEDSYGIHAKHTGEGRVGIDVRNVSVHTTGDYAHGVYAWQEGSYRFRDNGDSTRARGAVVVNLIETARDRESRIRPLVRTGGDYADAVRAEYTRAAAYGHVAVNVRGYTIATGGIAPLEVFGFPRQPGATPQEPRRFAFDRTRPYVANANYDPDDPNSPQYYNIRLRDDLQQRLAAGDREAVFRELGLNPIFPSGVLEDPPCKEGGTCNQFVEGTGVIDIRPYTIVYLPVRNPDYDPEAGDSDSNKPYRDSPAASVWNGRYFRALDESLATDVLSCQSKATEAEQTACIKEKIEDRGRDSGNPTGFEARGIYASHEGHGDIRVSATDNVIRTWGDQASGIYATHTGRTVTTPGEGGTTVTTPGGGGVSITVTGGSIGTEGEESHGIWGRHRGDSGADSADGWVDLNDIGTGNVNIRVTNAAIATGGDHARGVYGLIQQTRVRSGTDDDGNPTFDLVEGTGVGDIDIAVTGGAIATGGEGAAYAVHARHENKGDVTVRMTGVAAATEEHVVHGVFAEHRGSEGAVAVTVDGGSVATKGDRAHAVHALQSTDGGLTVRIANGATVSTEGVGAYGVNAVNDGDGDLTVELNGAVGTKGAPGIVDRRQGTEMGSVFIQSTEMASVFVLQNGDGDLDFEMTGGAVTAEGDDAHGVQVVRSTAGGGSIDVTGGNVRAEGAGSVGVLAGFAGGGTGTVSVTVGEGASVEGGRFGILLSLSADDDGNLPTGTVGVDGTVTGRSDAGIYLSHGGTVTVGRTGRVSSLDSRTAIYAKAGDLAVTVAGTVEGDLRAPEGGALTFTSQAGGTVTGTVHDPAGPLTVAGSVGRLLYSNAATVTVAATGWMTGVAGESESIRAAAGDLAVTVAGTVTGDLRPPEDGSLTFTSQAGSMVTGTVHDPAGPLTVAGSVGRLLYSNAATVTVAATGWMTGVAGESESIRAAAGDLAVTVAGTVTGDLRPPEDGSLTFTSQAGSMVTGTVHDPAGPLTVAGSVGRLLYSNGGTVSVAGTGRIGVVDNVGIRAEAGDLDVTLASGSEVTGDIRADAGRLTLDLAAGSAVDGTIHNPVGLTEVRSSIGRILYDNGGTITVTETGRLTGVEIDGGREALRSTAGKLTFTVDRGGAVMGDIRADVDLTGTISGTVEGDIIGLGSGDHTVTVSESGTVTGTIHLAGSHGTVSGTVGRVTLEDKGVVMVTQTGRVTGVPNGGHGVQVGADSTVTNHGMIAGQVGIRAGAGSTVVNAGTVGSTETGGQTGVEIGDNGQVTNSGTITGEVGIRAGAGSTVVNSGTVHSTDPEGIAILFPDGGGNRVDLNSGTSIVGKIQVYDQNDVVDASDVPLNELPPGLTAVDKDNIRLREDNFILPPGAFRMPDSDSRERLAIVYKTAFALTDDVLSDLTGNIHAAVIGNGLPAHAQEGDPAEGSVWAAPFGGARDQDGFGGLSDGTHYFGGGMLGAGWGTAMRVGVFLGGSVGQLDVDKRQTIDMQTVFGGVYAQRAWGDLLLDARVLMGSMDHDSKRSISTSVAAVEYTSIFFSPEVGIATNVELMSKLWATPRLRVRYAGLFTEGFRERIGTNPYLRYPKREVQILEARGQVGIPVAFENGGRIEPRVGLEGRYLVSGDTVEVEGLPRIAAGGDKGVATGSLGLGMSLPVADAMSLVGNFDGALTTEHAWRATGYLGLVYSF